MKTLTAADRQSLIRFASRLPVGSEERRAILAGLAKVGKADGKVMKKDEWDARYHKKG